VIQNFSFTENKRDNCICIKVKGSKFIILVLYVDDILLAGADKNKLQETKGFLSSNFNMKDLGEASYILALRCTEIGPKVYLVCIKLGTLRKYLRDIT